MTSDSPDAFRKVKANVNIAFVILPFIYNGNKGGRDGLEGGSLEVGGG